MEVLILKHKSFQFFTSLVVLICFVVTSVFIPLPAKANPMMGAPTLVSPQSFLSGLSNEIVDRESFWMSPETEEKPLGDYPLVVLLQEAHANFQAQQNIISTLDYFEDKLVSMGLSEEITIGLEGSGPEEINPLIFTAFPVPEITRDVTNSFMWDGKIDGAQYYAINNNRKAKLWGIDSKNLYQKNVSAYRSFLDHQFSVVKAIENTKLEVNRLKNQVYSKQLRDVEQIKDQFEKDVNQLRVYLRLLIQLSTEKGVSLNLYPAIEQMSLLFQEESKLDQKRIKALLSEWGMIRGVDEPESQWMLRVNSFWNQQSEGLKNENKVFARWIKFQKEMDVLASSDFFEQLERLEKKLYPLLARSRDERMLIQVDRDFMLLDKLSRLELENKHYQELMSRMDIIQTKVWWQSLDDLFERRGFTFRSDPVMLRMISLMSSAFQYYEYVYKRDEALSQNIEKLLKNTKQKIIFVVAGGFHTEGIAKRLKDKDISYWVMTPIADPDWDTSPYWELLAKQEVSLNQIINPATGTVKLEPRLDDPAFKLEAAATQIGALPYYDVPEAVAASLGIESDSRDVMFEKIIMTYGQNMQDAFWMEVMQELVRNVRDRRNRESIDPLGQPFRINFQGQVMDFIVQIYQGNTWKSPQIQPGRQVQDILLRQDPRTNHVTIDGYHFKLTAITDVQVAADSVSRTERQGTGTLPLNQSELPPSGDAMVQLFSQQVPQFRLIRELGRGAMGVVYEAVDLRIPGTPRQSAVKVIPFEAAIDAESFIRFKREAQAAAQVNDPGIVQSRFIGQVQHPQYGLRPFYAMDIVEGEDFRDVIMESPVPTSDEVLRERVRIIRDVARSLDKAHKAGVIHRDLKPANVIIANDGSTKIADFGLAHLVNSEEALTRTGDILGTPVYMAPEQINKSTEIDHRIDVWALGGMLYKSLTKEYPFSGPSLTAVLTAISMQNPTPIRSQNSKVSKEIEAIILKALEKQPSDRYQSASELADDLDRWLNNQPVQAVKNQGLFYRLQKLIQRNKAVAGILAAAIVTLAMLGAFSIGSSMYKDYQRNQELTLKADHINDAEQAILDRRYDDAIKLIDDARSINSGERPRLDAKVLSMRQLVTALQQADAEIKKGDSARPADVSRILALIDTFKEVPLFSAALKARVQEVITSLRTQQIGVNFKSADTELKKQSPDISQAFNDLNIVASRYGDLNDTDKTRFNRLARILLSKSSQSVQLNKGLNEGVLSLIADRLSFLLTQSTRPSSSDFSSSDLFQGTTGTDKISLFESLGFLLRLPGEKNNVSLSNHMYALALREISNSANATNEANTWKKATIQYRMGSLDASLTTLSDFQSRFASSNLMTSSHLLIARIRLMKAIGGENAQFETARQGLQAVDLQNSDPVNRLKLRRAILDTYVLEQLITMRRYRQILEPDGRSGSWTPGQGHPSSELGALYGKKRELSRQIEDYYSQSLQASILAIIQSSGNSNNPAQIRNLRLAFLAGLDYSIGIEALMGDLGNLSNGAREQSNIASNSSRQLGRLLSSFNQLSDENKERLSDIRLLLRTVKGDEELSSDPKTYFQLLGRVIRQRRVDLTSGIPTSARVKRFRGWVQKATQGAAFAEAADQFNDVNLMGDLLTVWREEGSVEAQSLGDKPVETAVEILEQYRQAYAALNKGPVVSLLQQAQQAFIQAQYFVPIPLNGTTFQFYFQTFENNEKWSKPNIDPPFIVLDANGLNPDFYVNVNGRSYRMVIARAPTSVVSPSLSGGTVAEGRTQVGLQPGDVSPKLMAKMSPVDPDTLYLQQTDGFVRLFNQQQAGRFRITKFLAKGGMGAVYQGLDFRASKTGRKVAIKRLLEHAGAEEMLRFKEEAESMVQLDFMGVVKIYAVGNVRLREGKEEPFFVMEFVEGGDLEEQIRRWIDQGEIIPSKPKSKEAEKLIRDRTVLFKQIVEAMARVHKRDFIHRDLKPQNILLGEGSVPYVTDFGLAKLTSKARAEELTRTGAVIGTPSFMSPEQATGLARDAKAPTDVWALGAILYYMLTGQLPFTASSSLMLMSAIMLNDFKRPSEINPAIPKDLEEIIIKTMEKSEESRYPSAVELAEDLENFLENRNVEAQKDKRKRSLRKRRGQLVLGALLSVVLLGGAAFYLITEGWRKYQARIALDAQRQRRASQIEEGRALIAQAEVKIKSGEWADAKNLLDQASDKLIGKDTTLETKVRQLRGLVSFLILVKQGLEDASINKDALTSFDRQFSNHFSVHSDRAYLSFLRFYHVKVKLALLKKLRSDLTLDDYLEQVRALKNLATENEIKQLTPAEHQEYLWAIAHLSAYNGEYATALSELQSLRTAYPQSTWVQKAYPMEAYYLAADNNFDGARTRIEQWMKSMGATDAQIRIIKTGSGEQIARGGIGFVGDVNTPAGFAEIQALKVLADINLLEAYAKWSDIPSIDEQALRTDQRAFNIYKTGSNEANELAERAFQQMRVVWSKVRSSNQNDYSGVSDARIWMSLEHHFLKALNYDLRINDERDIVDENLQQVSLLRAKNWFRGLEIFKTEKLSGRVIPARYSFIITGANAAAEEMTGTQVRTALAASKIEEEKAYLNFALAVTGRWRHVLVGRRNSTVRARFQTASDSFRNVSVLGFGTPQDHTAMLLQQISRQLSNAGQAAAATGQSLGQAQVILHSVQEQRNLTPIFMELNSNTEGVLQELTRRDEDVRDGNKANMVVFLVSDKNQISDIAREYGGVMRLWKDYRVALLLWKRPMTQMLSKDVEALLEKSMFFLRPYFPNGINLAESVFLNDSFNTADWEEGDLRIQFEAEKFSRDSDYRGAYLAASFYVAQNRSALLELFQRDRDSNTLLLLPQILQDLVQEWQNMRKVLIAA